MSLHIDLRSLTESKESSKFHSIPCEIGHSGSAKIDDFFTSSIRAKDEASEESKHVTVSFRGRPLNGKNIHLPSSYKGYILKEPRKNFNEEDDRHLRITKTFKDFTYWNLDKPVTANDRLLQAMDWIDIAKAVHSPVEEENSQKSIGDEH